MSRILQSASERRAETHPLTWRLHDDQSPVLLDEYRSTQGYDAVTKALEQHTYESLTEEVKTANLRGRGGAGFSAAGRTLRPCVWSPARYLAASSS